MLRPSIEPAQWLAFLTRMEAAWTSSLTSLVPSHHHYHLTSTQSTLLATIATSSSPLLLLITTRRVLRVMRHQGRSRMATSPLHDSNLASSRSLRTTTILNSSNAFDCELLALAAGVVLIQPIILALGHDTRLRVTTSPHRHPSVEVSTPSQPRPCPRPPRCGWMFNVQRRSIAAPHRSAASKHHHASAIVSQRSDAARSNATATRITRLDFATTERHDLVAISRWRSPALAYHPLTIPTICLFRPERLLITVVRLWRPNVRLRERLDGHGLLPLLPSLRPKCLSSLPSLLSLLLLPRSPEWSHLRSRWPSAGL